MGHPYTWVDQAKDILNDAPQMVNCSYSSDWLPCRGPQYLPQPPQEPDRRGGKIRGRVPLHFSCNHPHRTLFDCLVCLIIWKYDIFRIFFCLWKKSMFKFSSFGVHFCKSFGWVNSYLVYFLSISPCVMLRECHLGIAKRSALGFVVVLRKDACWILQISGPVSLRGVLLRAPR